MLTNSSKTRRPSARRRFAPCRVPRALSLVAGGAALALLSTGCLYNWTQFGGGAGHSGSNTAESTLTIANVATLHRVWQATLPATADGAPAYLGGVSSATGTRNLAFVTTRGGDIVAVDTATGATVWTKTFGPGTCKINNGSTTCYTTSSPAVDPGRAYVYSYGLDGKVHKLAVGTGTEVVTGGWPELVTLKGFDEKGSSALSIATRLNGTSYLYAATAGYPGDGGDYQGHIVAIDLATGAQRVFNTLCSSLAVHFVTNPGTPDCSNVQSGVWARAGTVYDAANDRLYISSGNGLYSPATHRWGDSVIALHPDGTGTAAGDPIDAYTPTNYQALQDADADLGSTLPAILPTPAASKVKRLAVMSGKDANLRLLNLDNLSGQGGPGHTGGEVGPIIGVPQGGGVLTQPTVWVNPADSSTWVFIGNNNGTSALKLVIDAQGNPTLATQWTKTTTSTTPLVANGVLYLAHGSTVGAYNPLTGAKVWSDSTLGAMHWQTPIVENGVLLIEDGSAHLNAYSL